MQPSNDEKSSMIDSPAVALNLQATQAKERLYWRMIANG
jgi:hypothetical protein